MTTATSMLTRIVALSLVVLICISSFSFISGNLEASDRTATMRNLTTESYANSDVVSLWVRRNGSDPGFEYGGANVSPSVGMDFFGTDTLQVTWSYSLDDRANYTLFPNRGQHYLQIPASAEAATWTADFALTDSRIMGAWIDDFPVSLQSPANMSAIYSALHHEDENLGRSLTLGLVVYNYNYIDQSPYSWADIEDYFDIIHFWFYPDTYPLLYPNFAGYEDAIRDFKSMLPTKEFWIGIYLHYYNQGTFPYDLTYRQMSIACRLIREGLATHLSILENFWIQHNPETAWLVANFINSELQAEYSTIVDVSTGGMVSYSGASVLTSPLIREFSQIRTNNYTFVADHLQSVILRNMSGASIVARDLRTGEVYSTIAGSGQVSFIAEPGESYIVQNMPLSPVTYNTRQYILAPTSWNSKEVYLNSVLNVASSLWINNSIVRIGPDAYKDSMKNTTTPTHGIILNATNDCKLYIKNSVIEPRLRDFPYYFNTTWGGAGTGRVIDIRNSTIACYAGKFEPIGYSYIYDSAFYSAQPNGGTYFGISLNAGGTTNAFKLVRTLIWNPPVSGLIGLFMLPTTILGTANGLVDNVTVAGGRYGLWVDQSYGGVAATLRNCLVFGTGLDDANYVRYRIDSGGADKVISITSPLRVDTNISVTALLKSASGGTIGSYTSSNGRISAWGISEASLSSTVVLQNQFPWSLTVTSSLPGASYYMAGEQALYHSSMRWTTPAPLSFNNSRMEIENGMQTGMTISRVPLHLYANCSNYVSSSRSLSLGLSARVWSLGPWSEPSQTTLSVVPSGGTAIVKNITVDYTNGTLASCVVDASTGTLELRLYSLAGGIYDLKVDGEIYDRNSLPDSNGTVTFVYSGSWSEHTFAVERSVLDQVLGMVYPILALCVIMCIVSVVVGGVAGFRSKK